MRQFAKIFPRKRVGSYRFYALNSEPFDLSTEKHFELLKELREQRKENEKRRIREQQKANEENKKI